MIRQLAVTDLRPGMRVSIACRDMMYAGYASLNPGVTVLEVFPMRDTGGTRGTMVKVRGKWGVQYIGFFPRPDMDRAIYALCHCCGRPSNDGPLPCPRCSDEA